MNDQKPFYGIAFLFLCTFLLAIAPAASPSGPKEEEAPKISLSTDMGEVVVREAARVREELKQQAQSLFERDPIGWNLDTLESLYDWALSLPMKIPELSGDLIEQGRILGAVGTIIVLIFISAVFYSLIGKKRVLARIQSQAQPLREKIPDHLYPYVFSVIKVVVEAFIPLILLGFFSLINALIDYRAAGFQFTEKVLILWALGAMTIGVLRESLTRGLFPSTSAYGREIYRLARLTLVYVLIGIAVFWGAEAFEIREDILSFLKFVLTVSIITVVFLLLLKKNVWLSLLPKLPYHSYRVFIHWIDGHYRSLIIFSFAVGLLWSLGYKRLGGVVLFKLWSTFGAFVAIMLIYHRLESWLKKWSQKVDAGDETAKFFIGSLKSLLLYATITATCIIVLNLLGLLHLLQQVMSFPVFHIGETSVTFWTLIRAALILLAFVYASRLIQGYFDYKVYPSLGIDPGLGYALNTFFKYTTFAVGVLISLRIVGIDLRLLLVFAGAIGIGVGLGLQNTAANVISGFTIIFGGKIRKGDWIEAGNTIGMVTDIFLRATKVRTRDNIEYLIPNSDLISKTIVNYSLSSPMIRIDLPVGVSYNTDPKKVKEILIRVAQEEPLVEKFKKPAVRFVEYGDNSINFELLFWINVRNTPRKKVRSRLYFSLFEEFKAAGIEIPFPQRDIHIRSTVAETRRA